MKAKIFFSAIFLFTLLNACISRVDKHGYMFDMTDHQTLEEGISSKERVLRIMGSPTLVADYANEESWIYYSQDEKKILFFKPEIIERNIVVLTFDDSDIIKKIQRFDLLDENKKLKFSTQFTAVDGHKVGFIKSFFGNVGQVRPQ